LRQRILKYEDMKISTNSKKTRAGHRKCTAQTAALFLALTVLLPSCNDDDQTPEPAPNYAIALSADTLRSRAGGDVLTVVVRSTADGLPTPFAVNSKPEWVSVQAIDDSTLQVIFNPNPLKQVRSDSIVLAQQAGDGTTASIILNQNALKTRHVWKYASVGSYHQDQRILALAFVEGDPNTVFCLFNVGGFYISTDSGKNWKYSDKPMIVPSGIIVDTYWMHWSSSEQCTLVMTMGGSKQSKLYIFKDDGEGLYEAAYRNNSSNLRSITIPAADDEPAFIINSTLRHCLRDMLISPDRNWTTAVWLELYDRFGSASYTGYAAKDYIYVGCNNGDIWRAPAAGLFGQDTLFINALNLDMTRFNTGYESLRNLQEADGVLYCTSGQFVLKSADKGENWTVHTELSERPAAVANGTLKVFADGWAAVYGSQYFYILTPGGEIAEAIPPHADFDSYAIGSWAWVDFVAYDKEHIIINMNEKLLYLAEEVVEEE
jgi:photosystem II stability/assembly factor-like uncharacterized protein